MGTRRVFVLLVVFSRMKPAARPGAESPAAGAPRALRLEEGAAEPSAATDSSAPAQVYH